MAKTRKPLVLGDNGGMEQLQPGDIIDVGAAKQVFTATNSNGGAITVGQVVYVDGAGSVDLAQANATATSNVIGLVNDTSIASTSAGIIMTDGVIESADWTAVIGVASLTAGSTYFLDPVLAGGLTVTPTTTAGNSLVRVGVALSATSLEITIDQPIKL